MVPCKQSIGTPANLHNQQILLPVGVLTMSGDPLRILRDSRSNYTWSSAVYIRFPSPSPLSSSDDASWVSCLIERSIGFFVVESSDGIILSWLWLFDDRNSSRRRSDLGLDFFSVAEGWCWYLRCQSKIWSHRGETSKLMEIRLDLCRWFLNSVLHLTCTQWITLKSFRRIYETTHVAQSDTGYTVS